MQTCGSVVFADYQKQNPWVDLDTGLKKRLWPLSSVWMTLCSATGTLVTSMEGLLHANLRLCCLCRLSRSHPWTDVITWLTKRLLPRPSVWMTLWSAIGTLVTSMEGLLHASLRLAVFADRQKEIHGWIRILTRNMQLWPAPLCLDDTAVSNRYACNIRGWTVACNLWL